MKELITALKNYGSFTILNDITKHGYARRAKDNDRSKTIPILLESGIIESVAPTEFMLRFVRFETEESKQNFINEFYFLTITEKGRLVYELLKWQKESVKEEREIARKASYEERRNIAKGLLKIVGMDIDEFSDYED